MGDRSWASFVVPVEYADFAESRVLDGWERRDEGVCVVFEDCEVSGGGYDEECQLHELGVPYHHSWAAGIAYPAGREINIPGWKSSDGIERVSAHEDGVFAEVNPDGTVNQRSLAMAIDFYRADALLDLAILA